MIIIPSRLHNRIKLFRSCIKLLFYFDGTYKNVYQKLSSFNHLAKKRLPRTEQPQTYTKLIFNQLDNKLLSRLIETKLRMLL